MHGYHSPRYGLSFSELGEVITLPESGVQVLKRPIDDKLFDVMGVYPYTVTGNWAELNRDLSFLCQSGAVSIVLVSDPFADDIVPAALQAWTVRRAFKTHYVVDLHRDWRVSVPHKIRHYARRAMRVQQVEVIKASSAMADQFWRLYGNLIDRHNVSGIQRMSRDIIANQLDVPGAMMATARDESEILNQIFLFGDGENAHGHLVGVTPRGYELNSSYAVIWCMLDTLEELGYSRVNLGGAVGNVVNATDGVAAFKRRWANEQRTAFLCGQILDASSYERLARDADRLHSSFFPAYRTPDGYLDSTTRAAT